MIEKTEARVLLLGDDVDLRRLYLWDAFPEALGTVFDDSYRRAMGGETGNVYHFLNTRQDGHA